MVTFPSFVKEGRNPEKLGFLPSRKKNPNKTKLNNPQQRGALLPHSNIPMIQLVVDPSVLNQEVLHLEKQT